MISYKNPYKNYFEILIIVLAAQQSILVPIELVWNQESLTSYSQMDDGGFAFFRD